MTDAGLVKLGLGLPLLTALNLSDTRVSSAGLGHLTPLAQLATLNLSHSAVRPCPRRARSRQRALSRVSPRPPR